MEQNPLGIRHRSTKAGVQTPATPIMLDPVDLRGIPAQQRPEYKPRQHQNLAGGFLHLFGRSTKAGVQTPATLLIIILARKLNSQAGLSWKFDYKVQNDLENSRHKDKIP